MRLGIRFYIAAVLVAAACGSGENRTLNVLLGPSGGGESAPALPVEIMGSMQWCPFEGAASGRFAARMGTSTIRPPPWRRLLRWDRGPRPDAGARPPIMSAPRPLREGSLPRRAPSCLSGAFSCGAFSCRFRQHLVLLLLRQLQVRLAEEPEARSFRAVLASGIAAAHVALQPAELAWSAVADTTAASGRR
jgi:hypothetical protein